MIGSKDLNGGAGDGVACPIITKKERTMILDQLEHAMFYKDMLPNLDQALKKLEELGENAELGRYDFDGGYLMLQEGDTKAAETGDFEAHRDYIDVQVVLGGTEYVVWAPVGDLKLTEEYLKEKDRAMYSGHARYCIKITEGMFYALFPDDAHKACRDTGVKTHYRKAVIKLPCK